MFYSIFLNGCYGTFFLSLNFLIFWPTSAIARHWFAFAWIFPWWIRELSGNQIDGRIPSWLGTLKRLQKLDWISGVAVFQFSNQTTELVWTTWPLMFKCKLNPVVTSLTWASSSHPLTVIRTHPSSRFVDENRKMVQNFIFPVESMHNWWRICYVSYMLI